MALQKLRNGSILDVREVLVAHGLYSSCQLVTDLQRLKLCGGQNALTRVDRRLLQLHNIRGLRRSASISLSLPY